MANNYFLSVHTKTPDIQKSQGVFHEKSKKTQKTKLWRATSKENAKKTLNEVEGTEWGVWLCSNTSYNGEVNQFI